MEYDANKKVFKLDEADRLAIRVTPERAQWPIEDVGHLFDEVVFAGHHSDSWVDDVYSVKSVNWRAREKKKRHRTLGHMREVLAANAFNETDLTIPPEV